MKPTDCRDKTFHTIQGDLSGRLAQVYQAWLDAGPATTRELSNRSGIDILNVRPRTTDLVNMGLVIFSSTVAGEGVYRARTMQEWEAWRSAQLQAIGSSNQLALI